MSSRLTYEELEEHCRQLEQEGKKLKEENERLRMFEHIYRTAIGITTNTVTVVDVKKRTLNQIFNEGEWTGVMQSMGNAPESIIETGIIYPDDCDAYRKFYDEIYSGKDKAECTIRVLEENRGWVWFTMYTQMIYNDDGSPQMAVCFSDDITAKKKAEILYQNFRDVVTNEADFIWEANLTQDIMLKEADETNRFYARTKFEKYSQISDASFFMIPESYRDRVITTFSREFLLESYEQARREIKLEYPFCEAQSREEIWLESTAYLTANHEGDICLFLCSKDVTKRKHQELELKKQAQRDPLCGLYNRRFFERRVRKCLETCEDERPVLLIVDVDDFKQINDTWGHVFGDQVIMSIADAMRENFRQSDFLARVGGDEYMIFLRTSMPMEVLKQRVEGLQNRLKNVLTPRGEYKDISLSVGSAVYHPGDSFEQMYQNADIALYKAKTEGKNQYFDYDHMK